jgi:hypothetical protein
MADGARHLFGFFPKQLGELIQEISMVLYQILRDAWVSQQPFDVSEAECQVERLGGVGRRRSCGLPAGKEPCVRSDPRPSPW